MRRAILIAMVLTLVVSGAALAALPTTILFQDNFNSYTAGTNLHNVGPKWSGYGNGQYTIVDAGGGDMVVQTAPSLSGLGDSWSNVVIDSSAYNNMFLHFKAKTTWTALGAETRMRESVVMANAGGTTLARWQLNSRQYMGRDPLPIGLKVDYAASAWHDFDLYWDRNGSTVTFKVDGLPYQTVAASLTSSVGQIRFISQVWNDTQRWQYDDIVFGSNDPVVPEPSSLLALSAFGAGMLGFIKRRRA